MPNDWKKAVDIPIHKMGDRVDYNYYRGISLLETVHEVL